MSFPIENDWNLWYHGPNSFTLLFTHYRLFTTLS